MMMCVAQKIVGETSPILIRGVTPRHAALLASRALQHTIAILLRHDTPRLLRRCRYAELLFVVETNCHAALLCGHQRAMLRHCSRYCERARQYVDAAARVGAAGAREHNMMITRCLFYAQPMLFTRGLTLRYLPRRHDMFTLFYGVYFRLRVYFHDNIHTSLRARHVAAAAATSPARR